jgi:hypothetical protein
LKQQDLKVHSAPALLVILDIKHDCGLNRNILHKGNGIRRHATQ